MFSSLSRLQRNARRIDQHTSERVSVDLRRCAQYGKHGGSNATLDESTSI